MKIVGFLQNAWSPLYAGGTWPRESWLAALRRSRSGQRLAIMERICGPIEWHNTTPLVGDTPDSILPPDMDHVREIVALGAGAFVACGRQATAVLDELRVRPLLALPHPAYRVVTNGLFESAGRALVRGVKHRAELQQRRGGAIEGRLTA